ncbi:MAG: DUF4292 domain-containing protein [Deltaproteobacteria bacterium]|nr:DUF4292 domain-containing protein [Deltaproteobacteria bacterium]
MKATRLPILLCTFLALSSFSCSSLLRTKPSHKQEASTLRLHDIFESIRQRNNAIQSLKAIASIHYGAHGLGAFGSHSQAAIVARRPYYLRIDHLAEFGTLLAEVSISDGNLTIYWPNENQYFKGLAGEEELARYLSVALDPDKVVNLITSVIPLEKEADYRMIAKKGKIILKGNEGEITVIQQDQDYLPIYYVAYDSEGSRLYEINLQDYEKKGESEKKEGIWFPQKLSAQFLEPKAKIDLEFQDLEINPLNTDDPRTNSKIFEIKIPENAKSIDD